MDVFSPDMFMIVYLLIMSSSLMVSNFVLLVRVDQYMVSDHFVFTFIIGQYLVVSGLYVRVGPKITSILYAIEAH